MSLVHPNLITTSAQPLRKELSGGITNIRNDFRVRDNFWVGNYSFPYWFEWVFRPNNTNNFPYPLSASGFEKTMSYIKAFTGEDSISLPKFVGIFCIFYNETGGKFEPIKEMGGEKYFFEPNSRGKISYNTMSGNIPCGTELQMLGKANGSQVNAWNGTSYPNDNLNSLAREYCDFSRFTGRGYFQYTGRSNYVKFLQTAIGKDVTKMTTTQLDSLLNDYDVQAKVFYNYVTLEGRRPKFDALDNYDFKPFGDLISGGWAYYVNNIYTPRCNALINALDTENARDTETLKNSEYLLPNKNRAIKIATYSGIAIAGSYLMYIITK
jgi:hypothetical protein